MPFDDAVAARVRKALGRIRGVEEKKMFGGLAFLVNGHMAAGVQRDVLVLRLGEEGSAAALREANVRPMDFTGRPMKTMVYVDPPGFREDEDLKRWVKRSVAHARSLPPKN